MYIKRALEKTILEMQNSFPVVLVTGPRQVGKTTMLQKLADNRRNYVTLDDPMVRDLAVSDPELFLQRFKPPLLLMKFNMLPVITVYQNVCRQEL